MSLDAMDWVWTHATARGTARLVLLAIADRAPGPDATAYAGTTMLVQRTRAARSSVRAAVDKLLGDGELVVVEGARGPRGETVYRIPGAVNHSRAESDSAPSGGPKSGPGPESEGAEIRPGEGQNPAPGGPESVPPGGSDSGPGRAGIRPGGDRIPAPRTQAPEHQEENKQQGYAATAAALADLRAQLAAAQVPTPARWSLSLDEQRAVAELVDRHGAAALVALAAARTTPTDAPKPARYWLRVWSDLDHAPARPGGAAVIPLHGPRPAPAASHTDNLLAGLRLLEQEQEGTA
ncbi:hypothetical protein ACFV5N_23415 [Streptomyces sp. NPDC059853]|uniref:hypothetical protein n=1 Tax=Streptomyces sp. NPDC059853 TaxID=3346973 RepID=UPI0036682175